MEVSPSPPVAALETSLNNPPPNPPAAEESLQKDVTRCYNCRRKVGLLGFKCRCGFVFCSHHRHADQHSCAFDYKAMQKAKITEQNPVVSAPKVTKI
jgi:hypothetical protein